MKRFRKTMGIVLGLLMAGTSLVQAADTIKVGILHSLSGTMAISETSLKDVALMTIEEINSDRDKFLDNILRLFSMNNLKKYIFY